MNQEAKSLLAKAATYAHNGDINNFSLVENSLCTNIYLKETDEEEDFFDKFYLLQSLSRVCLHQAKLLDADRPFRPKNGDDIKTAPKWLILWKGPFTLAHNDYIEEFLFGLSKIEGATQPYIVCIDTKLPTTRPYKGIKSIDLYKLKTTEEKIIAYKQLAKRFELAIWIACTQNVSLYMGNRFCKREAYWSMKHLKIKPGSIDFLLCGGHRRGTRKDGPSCWEHGTNAPFSLRSKFNEIQILLKEKISRRNDNFIFGVGVRKEKLSNKEYALGITKILQRSPNAKFVIATNMLKSELIDYFSYFLDKEEIKSRIVHEGWLKEESILKFLAKIDCYLDTYPMGSGLMGMYSTFLKNTYIGLNCKQTNNSSFVGALRDFADDNIISDLTHLGIANTVDQYIQLASSSYQKWTIGKACNIQSNQFEFVKSVCKNLQRYQMAEDYWSIIKKFIGQNN